MTLKKIIKHFNYETVLFILITLSIFITNGDSLLDYKKFIFLKILLILFISQKVNYRNEIIFFSKKYKLISTLISLLILSITASFLFSPFKISEFGYSWLRIRYTNIITDLFLYFSLFLLFISTRVDFKKLINFFIIPGIIYSIYLIVKIIITKKILNHPETFLFFDGSRSTGVLFTFYIATYLGFTAYNFNKDNIYKNILVFTLFLTIIFLLKGRASIISIMASYIILLLIFIKNNEKIKIKIKIIVFIFSIISSIFLSQGILEIIQNFEGAKVSNAPYSFGNEGDIFYIQDRTGFWKYAFLKFLESPYFGLGPGGFYISLINDLITGNDTLNINEAHTHPHNFLVQFLVELGVLGSLILIFLLGFLLIKSGENIIIKKNYLLLIPGLNMISMSVYGLFDGAFFHPTFTFLIVLSLSILSSEIYKKK